MSEIAKDAANEAAKQNVSAEVGDVGLPEDLARADLYGLIARFFQMPPDQELLNQIAATADQQDAADEAPLAKVWMDVVEVAKNRFLKELKKRGFYSLM